MIFANSGFINKYFSGTWEVLPSGGTSKAQGSYFPKASDQVGKKKNDYAMINVTAHGASVVHRIRLWPENW